MRGCVPAATATRRDHLGEPSWRATSRAMPLGSWGGVQTSGSAAGRWRFVFTRVTGAAELSSACGPSARASGVAALAPPPKTRRRAARSPRARAPGDAHRHVRGTVLEAGRSRAIGRSARASHHRPRNRSRNQCCRGNRRGETAHRRQTRDAARSDAAREMIRSVSSGRCGPWVRQRHGDTATGCDPSGGGALRSSPPL